MLKTYARVDVTWQLGKGDFRPKIQNRDCYIRFIPSCRDELQQFFLKVVIYSAMVLLTLIARVTDGLILATSIEGSDEVRFLEILFSATMS